MISSPLCHHSFPKQFKHLQQNLVLPWHRLQSQVSELTLGHVLPFCRPRTDCFVQRLISRYRSDQHDATRTHNRSYGRSHSAASVFCLPGWICVHILLRSVWTHKVQPFWMWVEHSRQSVTLSLYTTQVCSNLVNLCAIYYLLVLEFPKDLSDMFDPTKGKYFSLTSAVY